MSGNSGLGQCTHSQYVRDFVFLSGKCYYHFLCLWLSSRKMLSSLTLFLPLSFFQENVIIFVSAAGTPLTLSFFQENVIFPSCAQTLEDPEDLFPANHLCFAEKYKFLFCANHLCFHREIQPFLSFLMPLWFMKSWQAEK